MFSTVDKVLYCIKAHKYSKISYLVSQIPPKYTFLMKVNSLFFHNHRIVYLAIQIFVVFQIPRKAVVSPRLGKGPKPLNFHSILFHAHPPLKSFFNT